MVIADPEIFTVSLKGVSYLLLISDGVYERLANSEIGRCFVGVKMEEGIKAVFEMAERRKSEDNRSMVAINCK